jgi:hypothetical protein
VSKRKRIWCRVVRINPGITRAYSCEGDDGVYAEVNVSEPNPRVARCIVASRLSAMLRAVGLEPKWRRK